MWIRIARGRGGGLQRATSDDELTTTAPTFK